MKLKLVQKYCYKSDQLQFITQYSSILNNPKEKSSLFAKIPFFNEWRKSKAEKRKMQTTFKSIKNTINGYFFEKVIPVKLNSGPFT